MRRFVLEAGWHFRQHDPEFSLEKNWTAADGWLPATVPGVVHGDLLSLEKIPDPFQALNEADVQWVGECNWLYRCRFPWSASDLRAEEIVTLCFGGLDTFATVWLNDRCILVSDNMFLPHRIAVQDDLRLGENELRILFEAALPVGRARETEMGEKAVWNGDSSRVYVRKAQYHYGWDWGPCLLTTGPWQPVWLEVSAARISHLHAPVELDEALTRARVPVEIGLEGSHGVPGAAVELTVYGPDGVAVAHAAIPVSADVLSHVFSLEKPALWWPNGYGSQPLYRLVARLLANGEVVDTQEQRLGMRRVRLVQEEIEGEAGRGFRFEVNNTPIFCGGANWIPADMLLPRVTPERYRAYLQGAAAAHMQMIRVWGGGIYEADSFYDLCDELGLLVWQDFLFACGIYPAHPSFLASVRAEAEHVIQRLRHHPCLALWCGNNEDYSLASQQELPVSGVFSDAFPGRAIYEQLLREICGRLDPARPYWPGSPYDGSGGDDPRAGDQHVWEVWNRDLAPYQEYPRYGGRFVSEFGMIGLPSAASIAQMASPAERYPGSCGLDFHLKAGEGIRRMAVYLAENVRTPADITSYAYATQLVQAEALATALRSWRRRFGGPGRYACGGALVWQLNDCWPSISWSIVDDTLVPKMGYYAVSRALAPLSLELQRQPTGADIWASNSTGQGMTGTLRVKRWALTGEMVASEEWSVVLAPHQTTELGSTRLSADGRHVLAAELGLDSGTRVRASLWAEPLKYLLVSNPGLTWESPGEGKLRLTCRAPAKGVWIETTEPDETEAPITWSDNGFDLFPGEAYEIEKMLGMGGANLYSDSLRIRSLFDLQVGT
jgi:beta-mannosidase